MRKLMIAAAALAAIPMFATSASAQSYRSGYYGHGYNNEVRREQRECNRELRRADSRREYQRELRECRREIAQARREVRRDRWDHRRDRYRDGYYSRDRYGYRW